MTRNLRAASRALRAFAILLPLGATVSPAAPADAPIIRRKSLRVVLDRIPCPSFRNRQAHASAAARQTSVFSGFMRSRFIWQ